LIYPDRYKSEVNDVEMDSTLLMHAYTCGVCCFNAIDVGAATPEETLAKINRLPPAERQAALVKEA
jgi:hypothetical protein